ncbi:hypothetical protein [Altericista sp. CCNU0014]|uniref:hypothetical protein n=1 Tax=Altericista sp. CCNU0014 TaxID=3082949 RepID=UPI0038505750
MPIRILLQTTLLPTETDDWTIRRFSLLEGYLAGLKDNDDQPLCAVTARDRTPDAKGDDPVLSNLDRQNFDELWLFALDVGNGLSPADCAGIDRFHRQGGGVLTTRDHQDMGLSMSALPTLGKYHYFHTQQNDPDPERCCRDDIHTLTIEYPNYHSGRNGDYQTITPIEPVHALLNKAGATDGRISLFPAHPHEGGVGVPAADDGARVIATGTSQVTGRTFNLVVACDRRPDNSGNHLGRAIAQSTFHHFADYNWNIALGCPSFVAEPPGNGMQEHPTALEDIKTYVKNAAQWLAPL